MTNSHNGILDLIFSNAIIDSIHALHLFLIPIVDSYHPPLEFIFPVTIQNHIFKSIYSEVFNFNSWNFSEIITFLSNLDIIYLFI